MILRRGRARAFPNGERPPPRSTRQLVPHSSGTLESPTGALCLDPRGVADRPRFPISRARRQRTFLSRGATEGRNTAGGLADARASGRGPRLRGGGSKEVFEGLGGYDQQGGCISCWTLRVACGGVNSNRWCLDCGGRRGARGSNGSASFAALGFCPFTCDGIFGERRASLDSLASLGLFVVRSRSAVVSLPKEDVVLL